MTLYLEVSTSGMWHQEFSFTGIFLLEWGSSCSDVNWYVWHWTWFIPEDTRVEIQNSRIRKHQKKGPRLVKVLFTTPGWWFDPCSSGKKWGETQMGEINGPLKTRSEQNRQSACSLPTAVLAGRKDWRDFSTRNCYFSAWVKTLRETRGCLWEANQICTVLTLVFLSFHPHCEQIAGKDQGSCSRLGKPRLPVPRPPSVYGFKSHCDFFLCTLCSTVWGHKFQCSSVHTLPLQTASIIFEGRSVPCILEMPTSYIVRTHNRPLNCWVSQRSARGNSVGPNIC